MQKQIVFFDLETTGTDITKDRIVQYCFINIDTTQNICGLINPGIPIPESASKVHGITNEMVSDPDVIPSFKHVAPRILKFIENCDLGGYNVKQFDIPLLIQEFERNGFSYPGPEKIYDSLEIYRKFEPHTLSKAYNFYTQKEMQNAHEASADVKATIEVYHAQKVKYLLSEQDFETEKHPDIIGKLIYNDKGEVCFNFGKYQGQPIKDHDEYARWMLIENFPAITKNALRKALNDIDTK